MIRIFHLLPVCIFFLSCQSTPPDLGVAENYLPSAKNLENGIVNKYYIHFKSKDNYEVNTNIEYTEYKLLDSEKLSLNFYNPGGQLKRKSIFSTANDKMTLLSQKFIFSTDTVDVDIFQPVTFDWNNNGSVHEKEFKFKNFERKWKIEQIDIRDTTLDGRIGKVLVRKYDTHFIRRQKDTTKFQFVSTEIHLKDLGLYSYVYEDSNGIHELELIEQIPRDEFQILLESAPKRVGYINPKNRLDHDSDFKYCNEELNIADYYNGRPQGQFRGGKGALWNEILPIIKSEKLNGESGYLTFRFIINCKGQTGYFTTEQASLDFQKKEFHPETVEYLFNLISNLSPWQPAILQKKKRDVYAYLTFKLKDGKLIELLP